MDIDRKRHENTEEYWVGYNTTLTGDTIPNPFISGSDQYCSFKLGEDDANKEIMWEIYDRLSDDSLHPNAESTN